jgi:tryptophan-rich sensory protein
MSFLAGAVGSYFSFDGVTTWYTTLNLPAWTPPNWLFGPVWTVLYICMGIAAGLVAKAPSRKGKKYVLRFFGFHLILNAAWSFVFFGLHFPLLAHYLFSLFFGAFFGKVWRCGTAHDATNRGGFWHSLLSTRWASWR